MDINDLVEKTPDDEVKKVPNEEEEEKVPNEEKKKKKKKGAFLYFLVIIALIGGIIFFGWSMIKEVYDIKKMENVQKTEIKKIDEILKKTPDAKPFSDQLTVNSPIAMLNIESVNLHSVIYAADASYGVLDKGVAWDPNSKWVNLKDKTVLTGHRNFEFEKLQNVKAEDIITIEDNNRIYKYKVTKTEYVQTDDAGVILNPNSQVLNSTAPNETLVLYTCYPFKYLSKIEGRFVVFADRIE